jgi:signal transduction histidine kinase
MAIFSVAAYYYRNGAEYFLILNIVATVILFKKSVYIISLSAANAILFLTIKILQPYEQLGDSIPQSRVLFNIAWTLLFIIMALHYYKTEHLSYHAQIENTNEQLKQQQTLLLQQKNELQQKTNQLEILNHTKEKLFSVIAHDMRTPIAGLKSSLDLYHNQVISKEEFDDLSEGLTMQVDNIYTTLDNLLYWSHGQLNGITAKPEKTALKPLALQTISLMLQNAKLKQLHIDQKITDNLYVFADPNHIKLVLRNLLSNAIKFSHTKGIIEIEAGKSNDTIEIKVTDHGVGMSEASLNQLFKTETLLSKRGTQNEVGAGLGLVLSKEFVEKNNGKISVCSEEGKGSCFTIALPSI